MVLTFKSSIPEERVIIERGREGERVCRAVRREGSSRMWDLSLTHPAGTQWRGTFHGDGNTVQVALTQLLMDKENDYREEAARGHRPAPAQRDTNFRVDAFGKNVAAPIIPRR